MRVPRRPPRRRQPLVVAALAVAVSALLAYGGTRALLDPVPSPHSVVLASGFRPGPSECEQTMGAFFANAEAGDWRAAWENHLARLPGRQRLPRGFGGQDFV